MKFLRNLIIILIFLPCQNLFSQDSVKFAVIGDYGDAGANEQAVANLVLSWNPDFIVTVGDNNYPNGSASTIDENIGQYFHSFIYPYTGDYGEGSDVNKFWPVPGNHDWRADDLIPYRDYFELPNNERYYDVVEGPVHFFMTDSDPDEPDGVDDNSVQAQWIYDKMDNSDSPWKIVSMHHAPYSSGDHGSISFMQWNYKEHGASLILSGHDHDYERLEVDELTYIVNGIGGRSLDPFPEILPESIFRYNDNYGAVLIRANLDSMVVQFININEELIDEFTLYSGILPVELSSFIAEEIEKGILLNWSTGSEFSSKGFEIQRKKLSDENVNWKVIGFVEGSGNSSTPQNYQFVDDDLNGNGTYKYRLKQIDLDGSFDFSKEVEISFSNNFSFSLSQNYPNPFNPSTKINYSIPEYSHVSLIVYDVLGNEIKNLVNKNKSAGTYSVEFSTKEISTSIPSGIYFYRLKAGSFMETRKFILMK